MQIESLKTFCDLAETASFTKTARINEVTQSAVSQTIAAMEKCFRSLLVERGRKHFRLTPEGQVVYQQSKQILQTYEAILSKMQELKRVVSGTIRLATVYSIGLHDLPPYIRRFLKDCPDVNVNVEYRRASQIYEEVVGNVVDIGLVAYPHPAPKIEIVRLRKDPLVLACPIDHPLARKKIVKLKALSGQKFVSFEPDMPTRKALDRIFKDHGVAAEHVMEFDNIETAKRAVEIGCGVTIVPADAVRQEVTNQTLAAVGLEGGYSRELGAILKKGKVLSPALKKLIALLKTKL